MNNFLANIGIFSICFAIVYAYKVLIDHFRDDQPYIDDDKEPCIDEQERAGTDPVRNTDNNENEAK